MKKVLMLALVMALGLMFVASPAMAWGKKTSTQEDRYEFFDYGGHINFEYGVKDWLSLDQWNSYFHDTNEIRSTVGVTFKFGPKAKEEKPAE